MMAVIFILTGIVLQAAGIFAMYNIAGRSVKKQDNISVWFQQNHSISKITGWTSIVGSFVLFVFAFGTGAGILTASLCWMTAACLIILFIPLKLTRR